MWRQNFGSKKYNISSVINITDENKPFIVCYLITDEKCISLIGGKKCGAKILAPKITNISSVIL